MAVRRPLLPPRRLLVLFAGITMVLAGALVWLGSQLVRQDRALEGERARETLARAAAAVTAELQVRLAAAESSLHELVSLPGAERRAAMAELGAALGAGAALVEFTSGAVTVAPARAVLYDPAAPTDQVPTPHALARGERLEFRDGDLRGAAAAYRAHVSAQDLAVRGGALLRLARILWKEGRTNEALRAYDQLAALDTLRLHGLPAALLARHARIGVLRDQGRHRDAGIEADSLVARLAEGVGRWRLSRGSFEFYYADVHHVTLTSSKASDEALLLSRTVDSLWRAWPNGRESVTGAGRQLLAVDSTTALVLWSRRAGTVVMSISTPTHLRAAWLDSLQPLLRREGVTLALSDGSGIPVLASHGEGSDVATPPSDAARLTRAAFESGLPWALSVAIADPRAFSRDFAARRRVLLSSLVIVILLVLVGTYSVARAVNGELAVARLQSDFVAAVSHEFRTPLTSMRQVAELLDSGRVSSEERRAQYHAVLRREGDRLHRLVENLLDFGRMEAGAREFHFEQLDAAALVNDVVGEFRHGVASHGYDVALSAADAGTVRADREALGRALWNLMDNAVKYSPDHKTIDVSVARDNGHVVLSVRDHGVGIPVEEHAAIFQEFVRGQAAKASGIRGTGIGLAMVRHIVEAHGGEIVFTSAAGAGSTFTILLTPANT